MARLDQKLLGKLSVKTKKSLQSLRERISRMAGNKGISAEAALILLAKAEGIGTTWFQGRLSPAIREEVRSNINNGGGSPRLQTRSVVSITKRRKASAGIGSIVKIMLQDPQLQTRCMRLLLGSKHFDQAVREATTVLDDRLKKITRIKNMNPQNLISKAISPDPAKAILVISDDPDEQEGFYSICKGLGLLMRNPTHHELSDEFTREDALKICALIDLVLGRLAKASVHLGRIKSL
jgi:uncharacterized protein (TIGR02391 family)